VTLLEGLDGGRWALVTKIHHCLVDGVSGATIAAAMLDAKPEPEEDVTTLPALVSSLGTDEERGVLIRLRGSVGEVVSGGIDAALHPRKVISILSQSRAMVETLVRDELIAAPSTSLNRPIGASRMMAAVDVSMEDLQRIRGELGGTLNDVILAATGGGLRRLFESRGEDVDHVRAMVPVSLRLREASESLAGNKVSSLFVNLPVSEPDTLRRYREISAVTNELKRSNQASGWDGVVKVTGLAPPLVQSVIARLSFTPRLFNLTVTNIPASPITLYALGAPMRRAVPLVPIFSGHSVGVAVVSYGGSLTFGLNADRDAMPDLEVLRTGIEEALAELKELATAFPHAV
jgi:WS/DGAT/MGAT family acyltransferase